jgi:large subunit ribosomal protein L27
MGRDHTIFATTEGRVRFDAKANGRIYISVKPNTAAAAE